MAVGADGDEIFDGVNGMLLADFAQGLNVVDLYLAAEVVTVNLTKIEATDCTLGSKFCYALGTGKLVTLKPIAKYGYLGALDKDLVRKLRRVYNMLFARGSSRIWNLSPDRKAASS